MSRERQKNGTPSEAVISIVGPGMVVVGDCETDGTLRVEGTVRGSITAGKAVVVGKDGVVDGDIHTQDAVVAGHVTGTLVAGSRLELQGSSRIDGDVRARRMRLEEGAILNGTILMGEAAEAAPSPTVRESTSHDPPAADVPLETSPPMDSPADVEVVEGASAYPPDTPSS